MIAVTGYPGIFAFGLDGFYFQDSSRLVLVEMLRKAYRI